MSEGLHVRRSLQLARHVCSWHLADIRFALNMCAFWGKADMPNPRPKRRLESRMFGFRNLPGFSPERL
jgi:hypothetical protein